MKDFTKEAAFYFEQKIPADIERYTDINTDIAIQVGVYLEEKGWSQKDFAKALGKSEAEVSKWLSGIHNLTLKSIAKMEVVLGKDIILTPRNAKELYYEIKYVSLVVHASTNIRKKTNYTFNDFSKKGQFKITC